MEITDRFTPGEQFVGVAARRVFADGSAQADNYSVITEHTLDVFVNEVLTMRIICTPSCLVELVVGRLYTEGIVSSVDEIESVYVCEFGTRARVMLRDKQADFTRTATPVVPTCCTGNKTYNAYFADGAPLAPVVPIEWHAEWIFAAAARFSRDSPLHARTYGTHSCYLMLGGEILMSCEDLGRHNAFDKVLGRALIEGVDLTQCILFSSGRIPEDMITKAISAGVPVLATKAVPTDAAIEIARAHNLTFICSAHPDSMVVCNDPTQSS
jgi:FdhD protein